MSENVGISLSNLQSYTSTTKIVVFSLALLFGTACSLSSKILLSMRSHGMSGREEDFSFPLFQTFGMFTAMLFGLLIHFLVVYFEIPFPGYLDSKGNFECRQSIPSWLYFFLILPSVFDLSATALFMFGLKYVNVSIYQMLRGGSIVFVALIKHFILHDKLKSYHWIGVFWNLISILLVGIVALFATSSSASSSDQESESKDPIIGIFLILLGALVQSLQYPFEEKVMTMNVSAPPLFLIGMEGFWGTLICVFILYPMAYMMPGSDNGSIENPFNTIIMIQNSVNIQIVFMFYFLNVFLYNILGILVTYLLDSVWRAILDNFRPVTVWIIDLLIFYMISTHFGESWTNLSYLQVISMFVLLYGTAIYNAPNQASILLTGNFSSCYINCTHEYNNISPNIDEKDTQLQLEFEPQDVKDPSSRVKFLSSSSTHPLNLFSASPRKSPLNFIRTLRKEEVHYGSILDDVIPVETA
eukprot:gene2105-4110_t